MKSSAEMFVSKMGRSRSDAPVTNNTQGISRYRLCLAGDTAEPPPKLNERKGFVIEDICTSDTVIGAAVIGAT